MIGPNSVAFAYKRRAACPKALASLLVQNLYSPRSEVNRMVKLASSLGALQQNNALDSTFEKKESPQRQLDQ